MDLDEVEIGTEKINLKLNAKVATVETSLELVINLPLSSKETADLKPDTQT